MADTGAHHVNVIAHSYGGLVARLYAWDNPSAVDRLVLVGTPNGGSELADAACLVNDAGPWGSIVWAGQLFDDQFGVCGGPDDALFQLQTDYVRNVFNANVRDRNGTEYWVLSGALPDEDRFLGLDFFPGADDGVVTLDSSQYLADRQARPPRQASDPRNPPARAWDVDRRGQRCDASVGV